MTKEELIEFCKADPDMLLLLETDRAGEEVDNGMGVEFDLKPYAIVTFNRELRSCNKSHGQELDKDIQMFLLDKVMILNAHEEPEEVVEMLDRLAGDGYRVIWTNESYKYPDKPKSEIKRAGTVVIFKVKRSYELVVSYEELIKYFKARKSPSPYSRDLFIDLLSQNPDSKKTINKIGFVSDTAKLQEVRYDTDGVRFLYTVTDRHEESVTEDWEPDEEKRKRAEKVEEMFESGLFTELSNYIEKRVKSL